MHSYIPPKLRSASNAVILSVALAAASSVTANAGDAFDLDALITAAKAEKPITVYDSTGKIVEMGDAFTKKYGVQAVGTKIKADAQFEMIIREAQAHNVQGDVFLISDPAAAEAQLIPNGFVTSWLPPDLADKIPASAQDPLVVTTEANVFTYNTELHDSCPVTNIWQLTEPQWKGKITFQDPLHKTSFDDWFNQVEKYGDDKMAAAYKAEFGKDINTGSESATKQWVKALAANGPLLTDSDDAASDAVGTPGQKESFMGMMSTAKFRENAASGMKLGLCKGLNPWAGWLYGKVGLITAGSDSPNAAKLFIRYAMTAEGIAPQAVDGKMSSNADVGLPDDEPSGIAAVMDQIFPYEVKNALNDWDARQDWQDLWRLNYRK